MIFNVYFIYCYDPFLFVILIICDFLGIFLYLFYWGLQFDLLKIV